MRSGRVEPMAHHSRRRKNVEITAITAGDPQQNRAVDSN